MLWDNYNLFRGGQFHDFWSAHLAEKQRKLLFVIGSGFDPRLTGPAARIIEVEPNVHRHCIAVNLSQGYTTNDSAHRLGRDNQTELHRLFPSLEVRNLQPLDADRIRNVAKAAQTLLQDVPEIASSYTDLIVDISALPRLVYLTFINLLLQHFVVPGASSPLGGKINVHIVYAESAMLDRQIKKMDIEGELAPLGTLGIRLDEEKSLNWPIVWFPVLAEDVGAQLISIEERTNPQEICPVLPAQCGDPRRPDNIIHRLGESLFDKFGIDKRDILRATEWNPFQLYRNLVGAMNRYSDSLGLLGGARFVISPLSSKGLSIGCLLATYEMRHVRRLDNVRVGMSHIESRRFEVAFENAERPTYEVISAWLVGECYLEQAAQKARSRKAARSKTR